MIKKTLSRVGAVLCIAGAMSCCTVTPEQAANLELIHKIYGLTVTVGK